MKRVKQPNNLQVMKALATLNRTVPTDSDKGYALAWRQSDQGAPNLRVMGRTHDTDWVVDIYAGHFYRVRVRDQGDIRRNLPEMIWYLQRLLRLTPSSLEEQIGITE